MMKNFFVMLLLACCATPVAAQTDMKSAATAFGADLCECAQNWEYNEGNMLSCMMTLNETYKNTFMSDPEDWDRQEEIANALIEALQDCDSPYIQQWVALFKANRQQQEGVHQEADE